MAVPSRKTIGRENSPSLCCCARPIPASRMPKRLSGNWPPYSWRAALLATQSDREQEHQAATDEDAERQPHSVEARYRALVEQIPAVVFMAYLDKGIGEAYVSPQIEAALGFSQSEWLEDPCPLV